MLNVRIGIVGSGMIAGVVAGAIKDSRAADLAGVASRRPSSARAFAEEFGVERAYATWQEMVEADTLDALYIATPTVVKEEICTAAARCGKHILVDKPFMDIRSLDRIIAAARSNNVSFMDATHFSHHPRTHQIKKTLAGTIGKPHAVRTSFFFPFLDRANIRFNPEKEPTGAVGDMAWYSMRAAAEYLQPAEMILQTICGGITRDKDSGAVVGGSGTIVFADEKTTTFNFGYNAGVCLMDLDILGSKGMVHLDDFVLDWKNGFAFDNPDHVVGYIQRSEMQSPEDFTFIKAESTEPQANLMVRAFVRFAQDPGGEDELQATAITRQTQYFLDAFWDAVNS